MTTVNSGQVIIVISENKNKQRSSNLKSFIDRDFDKKNKEQLQINKEPLLRLPIYKPNTNNRTEIETE